MNKTKVFVVSGLVVILIAASVFYLKRSKPIAVELAAVERGKIERTVTNTRAGTLNACRRARLSPSLGGQIANLPVKEGEAVKQGQLLFEIWNDDLKAQLQLAQAQLSANQALQQQSCIQADLAEREADRLTTLKTRGLASDEQTEKAVGQAQSARASCQATKANVKTAQAQILVAEAALQRSQLRAPFDGTIAEVNGELGEYVTPTPIGIQTTPAVDIIDTSCLYVSAPIDEVDAPQIRTGMLARISLDAFRGKFFDGRVRRVAPYVLDREKQARTVEIEVDFISAADNLNMLPGYTADVEVIIDAHDDSLRIPTEALVKGHQVYLYDANFRSVSLIPVKVGLSNWQYSEIIDGLKQGQQIVKTIDHEGLADGVTVKVEKSTDSKAAP